MFVISFFQESFFKLKLKWIKSWNKEEYAITCVALKEIYGSLPDHPEGQNWVWKVFFSFGGNFYV